MLERYLALVSSPFASNLMCGFRQINFLSLGPLFFFFLNQIYNEGIALD